MIGLYKWVYIYIYILENYVAVNLICKVLFDRDMQSNKIVKEFYVITLQFTTSCNSRNFIRFARFFNVIA